MVALTESSIERRNWMEPGRGVYDAPRAAALSGVPLSTLHRWARTGLYLPSVSPAPHTRLWSWADLLALRAIDWFRKGDEARARARVADIRLALAELEGMGYSRDTLSHILALSGGDGQLYLQLPGRTIRAHSGGQVAIVDTLALVAPYKNAPDLLRPRPLLRIIPGKLHGEPHVVGTRIPSLTLAALAASGYSAPQIEAMYPDATLDGIATAIEFEGSLAPPATA